MSDANFQGINPTLASNYGGGGGTAYPNGRAGSIIYGATNGGQPLSNAYPFSLGPHIGVAYQITPKTVFRAGGSIAYSSSPDNAFLSYSVANFYTVASPGQFLPASQLSNGTPLSGALTPTFPEYNQYPFPISSTRLRFEIEPQACIPPQEPFITIAEELRQVASDLPVEHRFPARDHAEPDGGRELRRQSRRMVHGASDG